MFILKNKKKYFVFGILSALVFLSSNAMAKEAPKILSEKLQSFLSSDKAQENVSAFIYFKDKGKNTDEKLLAAKNALSPRALQRRIINRGADNVVDFTDIPINSDYLEMVKTKVSKIRHQLKHLNAVSVEATPNVLAEIAKIEFVKKITLVKSVKRKPGPVAPPQQLNENQATPLVQPEIVTALDYGSSFTQNNQINVPAVHDLGYNGGGVIVAIFDAGFNRLSHETFDQMDIAGTWDFVNGDSDVGDGGMGSGSHGTNTLSTIGGYSPGDLIGPAYGATYYLAKTENTESELHVEEDNWCAAAQWAETNGAQIITSSLGYNDFDSGGDYSPSDMDGDTAVITICADLAAEKGIVVINSAGNSGSSSQNTLGAPSDGHFVLAVGAVTSSGSRSSFSSVGLSADGRIKPDVMAMGSSVRVASSSSNTGYTYSSGTSFSCPLTAGVAALLLQSNQNLTAAQVRNFLRTTADNASSPDRFYGYGIINALAAVDAAVSLELTASFTYLADALAVTFTDSSTTPAGAITDWAWNFGDGNTSSLQSPTHSYSAPDTYDVSLTVNDSDGETDTVSQQVAVADTPSSEYCDSQGNNNDYEWVSQVDVGTFSNSSNASGYSDFTSMIINLSAGQSYATTLSPGFTSGSYREYWKVGIDFNKDGDFSDSGEDVLSGNSLSNLGGTITIPASADAGSTRMRVSMQYNSSPPNCGSFTYGEVEDYTVNISNP
jgi:serine protease AprX